MVGFTRSDRLVTALLNFRSILATAAETFHLVKSQIEMGTSWGILHQKKLNYSGIVQFTFATQPHPNLGIMRIFGNSPTALPKMNIFASSLYLGDNVIKDKLKVDRQCPNMMRFHMRYVER